MTVDLRTLSEDQSVVLTVLRDRQRRGDPPATAEEIARETSLGVGQTRRALQELVVLGLASRTYTRGEGVSWETRR